MSEPGRVLSVFTPRRVPRLDLWCPACGQARVEVEIHQGGGGAEMYCPNCGAEWNMMGERS